MTVRRSTGSMLFPDAAAETSSARSCGVGDDGRAGLALLCVCTGAGSALAAGTHPAPSTRSTTRSPARSGQRCDAPARRACHARSRRARPTPWAATVRERNDGARRRTRPKHTTSMDVIPSTEAMRRSARSRSRLQVFGMGEPRGSGCILGRRDKSVRRCDMDGALNLTQGRVRGLADFEGSALFSKRTTTPSLRCDDLGEGVVGRLRPGPSLSITRMRISVPARRSEVRRSAGGRRGRRSDSRRSRIRERPLPAFDAAETRLR